MSGKKRVTKKEAEEKCLEKIKLKKPEEIFKPQGQVKFYNEEQPIYYDENSLWWIWDKEKTKWKLSDEVDILNRIEEITGEDIISPKQRVLILNSLKQECRKSKPLEIKSTWIQFKDEIFDIETGKKFKACPDYFVTNPIPYKMHNGDYESTPTIDRIFEEWVGEKYKQTLYEIIAYCLLPDYPIHRLFCFLGVGMNGKSCFLRLLRKFVGRENTTSTELDRLTNSRFEVTRLHKKLVCLMGETNFNEMKQTAIIKGLTGQDEIPFEYKNKNPFTDVNYAKLIIATNNLPTTTDKTIGWYRRWCIIDFPNRFSEEKNILDEIPDEEYEALALKCTGILKNLLENRGFHNEGSIEERMEKYEAKSDFLQKFIEDFTKENINGHITSADFFKKFNSWCRENRHREVSEKSLGLKLKVKGYESERKYFHWLFDGKGGQIRVWIGIGWKD